jgi:hypothetical protein
VKEFVLGKFRYPEGETWCATCRVMFRAALRAAVYKRILKRGDKAVQAACDAEGVSSSTFYRWNRFARGDKRIALIPTKTTDLVDWTGRRCRCRRWTKEAA